MSERPAGETRLAFGAEADLYDRVRPSYPADALRWAVGDEPRRVVDLGAGTGILTRGLRALGHDVVAVEPDEAMLARLAAASPDVDARAGRAESIPLPDADADLVVAAQAHWWFDAPRAYPEIARVLRPGGAFVALWNAPDTSVPFAAELHRIESGRTDVRVPPPAVGSAFGPPEEASFAHRDRQPRDALLDLVRSRAAFIVAPRDVQQRIERETRDLAATLPSRIEIPYVTYAVRAGRR